MQSFNLAPAGATPPVDPRRYLTSPAPPPAPEPAPSEPPVDPRKYLTSPAPPEPVPEASPVAAGLELRQKFDQHLESLSGLLKGLSNRLDFDVVGDSNQLLVRFVDRESGQVIRQVPAQELIEMQQRLENGLGGFMDANV